MKKPTKIVLGVATLWLTLYPVVFVGLVFYLILLQSRMGAAHLKVSSIMIIALVSLHLLYIFLLPTMGITYVVNVFKNDRVEKDKKIMWLVVLLLGLPIAAPIYWYLYIWREPKETIGGPPPNTQTS